MSLASVLVISANVRSLALNVFASACAACLALRLGAVGQKIQRRLDRKLLRADLEAQRRDRLIEQAVPRAAPGQRFLLEELLDAVLKLVRLVLADVFEPRPIVAKRRRLHRALQQRLVETIELEREEQQMHRRCRQPFRHVAVELRDRGIDRVARMDQPRIRAEPAHQVVDRLVSLDHGSEPLAAAVA